MIDIRGLDKADVLAALYNRATMQGLGFLHFDPTPMTKEEAQKLLTGRTDVYFDYVKGRVMKVDLTGDDEFEERLYDRDNGVGAAASVIDSLRKNAEG